MCDIRTFDIVPVSVNVYSLMPVGNNQLVADMSRNPNGGYVLMMKYRESDSHEYQGLHRLEFTVPRTNVLGTEFNTAALELVSAVERLLLKKGNSKALHLCLIWRLCLEQVRNYLVSQNHIQLALKLQGNQ